MGDASSGRSGESFIGSRISLISMGLIRYEGILHHIDISHSSICLQNVMSFGTEGRKEGPQIPCSDKVYDFIIFRKTEIQDLQILPPLSVPNVSTSKNDPVKIIQSQHTQEAPTVPFTMLSDKSHSVMYAVVSMDNVHSTMHPTYQSALPQTSESSDLPMNWPGLEASHMQPPRPGLPSSMLTEGLLNSRRLVSSASSTEGGLQPLVHANAGSPLLYMNADSSLLDVKTDLCLVTPQRLLSGVLPMTSKMAEPNPAERLQPMAPPTQDPLLPVRKESFPGRQHKQGNGTVIRPNYLRRGRSTSHLKPCTMWQAVSKSKQFTEDFNFDAMNERFKMLAVHSDLNEEALNREEKKDWGASKDDATRDELSESDPSIKPYYLKDDFFDSLSCDTLGQAIPRQRVKSFEQRKIDVETFGSSSLRFHGRHRGYIYRGPRRGGGCYYGTRRGKGNSDGLNKLGSSEYS